MSPAIEVPDRIGVVPEPAPRQKIWRHPKLLTEHAFDKLRLLDCTFAEFEAALDNAEVIRERAIRPNEVEELLLVVQWKRPLHVVLASTTPAARSGW